MRRTRIQNGARRVLPALAALTLAGGALTACSAGAGDVTAPTLQETDAREDGAPRAQAAVRATGKHRSGYLLSTGRDDDQGDDEK